MVCVYQTLIHMLMFGNEQLAWFGTQFVDFNCKRHTERFVSNSKYVQHCLYKQFIMKHDMMWILCSVPNWH